MYHLGVVKNLEGLQVACNPIENVPFEVLAHGFQAIIDFLKDIHNANKSFLPVCETVITHPSGNHQTDHSLLKEAKENNAVIEMGQGDGYSIADALKVQKLSNLSEKVCLDSVRGLERSELDGSHGCPGRLWDRFL